MDKDTVAASTGAIRSVTDDNQEQDATQNSRSCICTNHTAKSMDKEKPAITINRVCLLADGESEPQDTAGNDIHGGGRLPANSTLSVVDEEKAAATTSVVCSVADGDSNQDTAMNDPRSRNHIHANSTSSNMDKEKAAAVNVLACSDTGGDNQDVSRNEGWSGCSISVHNAVGTMELEENAGAATKTTRSGAQVDNSQDAASHSAINSGVVEAGKENAVPTSFSIQIDAVDNVVSSGNDGDASLTMPGTTSMDRSAALKAKMTQKLLTLRKQNEEKQALDDQTIDRISGLRIADRLLPQSKWELCMRGKRIVPFAELKSIKEQGGRDQVVVGVLWKPAEKRRDPTGVVSAEFGLTNLDKRQSLTCSLLLMGRAKDHWVDDDGPGRAQATVGSIFAVLNPAPTQRVGTLRINFETQLVKVGNSSALAHCSAMLSCGKACMLPYNKEADKAEYCFQHATMSPHARSLQRSNAQDRQRAAAQGSIQGYRPSASGSSVRLGEKRMRDGSTNAPYQVSAEVPGLRVLLRAATTIKEARSASEALVAIKALETMEITAPALKRTKLYDVVGSAMTHHKGVAKLAEVASRLRRHWRALLAEHD